MLDSTDPVPEAPGTVLALLDAPLVPQVFLTTGSLEEILTEVEAKVRKELDELDISIPKDRRAMRSLGLKVAKTKTGLDGLGKDATAEIDKVRDGVLDSRKAARDRLDALRKEVDQPVDEFEAADERRVEDHEAALRQMSQCAWWQHGPTIEDIDARKAELAIIRARPWQEFEKRAGKVYAEAEASLEKRRAEVIAEAEAAVEAARVAAELAEQERLAAEERQRQREAEIAAAAAEQARLEAEAAAQAAAEAERQAAQKRDYARRMIQRIVDCGMGFIGGSPYPYPILVRELEEKVTLDAETFGEMLPEASTALQEAMDRLQAGMQRQREQEEAEAAAERERWALAEEARQNQEAAQEAERLRQQEEQNRKKAEEEREAAVARAAAAEQLRQRDAELAEQQRKQAADDAARKVKEAAAKGRAEAEAAARKASDEAAEREKDRGTRNRIHGEVLAGLKAIRLAGLTETQAMEILQAIADGQVPHVSIAY